MTAIAAIVLLVYAVLMLAGGVIGYRAAGSKASLIAGAVSGAVLFGAYAWSRSSPQRGFALAAVVALLLAINFGMRFAKSGNFMPPGMLMTVSIVALVVLAWAAFRP